ncbi:MAG: serine hydrolase domain-containing protein [Planctomycetota bacterium]
MPSILIALALWLGSDIAIDATARARIDQLAEAALRDGPVAGLSIAVGRGSETIFASGYGYADVENGVPATPETVYRIGSITKQFTAAAILSLRAEGKLALDDPLTRHLPEFPTRGHQVTIHHLLTHSSGIKSYTELGPRWTRTVPLDMTHAEIVDLFKDEPYDFAPGHGFHYSNSGYFLLGMIIEKASGQTYADYLRDHVFAPAGLTATCYGDERSLIKHRAQGYDVDRHTLVNDRPISMTQPYAAGALCSTVLDLLRWQRALVDYRLLDDEAFALMTTAHVATQSTEARSRSYGYGVFLGELERHPSIQHGGGINGFVTQLAFYPDDDLTIAVLANTDPASPGRIEEQIARLLLKLPPLPEPVRIGSR